MRIALALTLVALGAVPAAAQSAGDRYGYGPSPRAVAATASQPLESLGIHPLTWASKSQSPVAPPAADASPAQSMAPVRPQAWARDLPSPVSAAPRRESPSAYQAFQPQAPYGAQQLAALTPARPQPLMAPPAPASPPGYRPPRGPELAGGPAAKPEAPQQVAQAAAHGGAPVHYYSLHRGYGLTPDAIPEPPAGQHYVLMGPPDKASAPSSEHDDNDDDTQTGKTSRPF